MKIIKRTLIIFAIGLFLNGFPYFGLAEYRIPGVLQRIAVCYFFASIIFLNTKVRTQIAITIGLLLVYWLMLKFIPAPGYAAGDLTKEGSLPSFIDRVVFGKARLGAGEGLRSRRIAEHDSRNRDHDDWSVDRSVAAHGKVAIRKSGGDVCCRRGLCCDRLGVELFLPDQQSAMDQFVRAFHRRSGVTVSRALLLADRHQGYRRWAKPFEVFGLNAIALYVGAGLMASLLGEIKVGETTLGTWIYENVFASWASPVNASLAFAIAFVLVWLGLMWILYRRKIFLKV